MRIVLAGMSASVFMMVATPAMAAGKPNPGTLPAVVRIVGGKPVIPPTGSGRSTTPPPPPASHR